MIGYKGTNENMECRNTQYELGATYYIDKENNVIKAEENLILIKGAPKDLKLCSSQVIHYCNKLEDCYNYYSLNETNRFFKVEIIGQVVEQGDKAGTTALKFLEEVDTKPLLQKREDELEDHKMYLDSVRALQTQFPYLILGGSLALYLQGAQLKRIKNNGVGDLDLIHPFYVDLKEFNGIEHVDAKNSGNTFDETYTLTGHALNGHIKVDLSICNETKYEIVEYKGHKYRVNTVEDILSYKCQYAKQKNGEKHKNDIRELIGLK